MCKDIFCCLNIADNWDEWEDSDDARFPVAEDMAKHRRKHGSLKEAHWKRWMELVTPSRFLTMDESRIAGWYRSAMMIGPEPKPIRTGATLHTLCVTKGPLAGYKLFVQAYGGKSNEDLNKRTEHCSTIQK